MSNLKQLISSRGNYRGQVNNIHKEKDKFSEKNNEEKERLIKKLNRLQDELGKLDSIIRDLKWEENLLENEAKALRENDKEIDDSTTYEDKITECIVSLSQSTAVASSQPIGSNPHGNPMHSLLRSPTAPLPSYTSSDGEDLIGFFKQFEETTSRFNFTDYDKFLLLKQQISGRAVSLINSLDSSQHSYANAKKLLLDALASPAVQKFNIIKQMAKLKLEYNTEPFEYIGQINNIKRAFDTLKVSTDDILQYFAWLGLNESFKYQFIQITNETRPSLDIITSKFFEVSERYHNAQQNYKTRHKVKEHSPKDTTCLATAIT